MNILLYYPSNKRTIPIDLPLFELQKKGHTIFLLTTESRGTLHDLYEAHDVATYANTYTSTRKFYKYVRQIIFLVKFCHKHKIDIVHSHLQQVNVIAVVAKFFMRSKVIIFRHHCKFHTLVSDTRLVPTRNELIGDRLINKLSSLQIVPSKAVRDHMIKYEKVSKNKLKVIPYIYDFGNMEKFNIEEVASIRESYPAKLRIIMVSRLTPFKRHMEAILPIVKLIEKGLDLQLLIMDNGPELENLTKFVTDKKLLDRVHFLGFRYDILNYIRSSDMIIHPSLTDASNSAIKEAALLEKIVVTCNKVGDFNDYIKHNENGFLLTAANFQEELLELIPKIYTNKDQYVSYGQKLKEIIVGKYSVSDNVVDMYENL